MCYLIEPGDWQGRGLGGFLEEVISEMGTGGGVPPVRIWGKGQHSKQNPSSEIKSNAFEPGLGSKMGQAGRARTRRS